MNSLKLTATLNRKYIRSGRKATLYLLLDIEAAQAQPKESRLPLNLGFVIDRSGSMSGEKLHYTKQAVHYIDRREGAILKELMEGGAVSARTVYRDIEALSQSGLPVLFDGEGDDL